MADQNGEEHPTDLGTLWTEAVKDYAQKTGHNIEHMASQNLNDVMAATSKELKTFGGFRHDGGKVDKVRSAFQGHLGNIQKCVDGLQMVGAAAGAFPPAMPVGIVFSACGRLLSAFAAASAQYDKVEDFFNHASRFFERLSLLEGKADSKPMALAVVRVFSTQLSICGIAHRLVSSGRVKMFFNMLWKMEDPQLSGAYAAMQKAIEELGATVGMASYSAIRNTQEDVGKVSEDVNKLDEQITIFRSNLKDDVYSLYASNLAIHAKVTEGFIAVRQKQDQSYELQMYMAQQQDQILKAITQTTPSQDIIQAKGDVGDASIKAAAQVRSFFEERPDTYPDFARVYDANLEQHEFLEKVMVSSTNEWLYSEPAFLKWRTAMNEVIWLQAPDGTGKTFLTCGAYQTATTQWGESASCGYFYFFPNRSSVETALACIVMQIVSRNDCYAEVIGAQLREEAINPISNSSDTSTWERFFASTFTSDDSSQRLILFLDGFDEVQEDQKRSLVDLAEYSQSNNSRISIFLTTRRSSFPNFGSLSCDTITITKEKVLPGLTLLIRKRFEERPELRRLSKAVKKAIFKSLLKHADSMLYADHMLQRLSSIGREGVILRALDTMPGNLTELFRLFEEECIKGRTKEQLDALKALFIWIAYSERSLTMSELSALIAHTAQTSQGGDQQQKLLAMQGALLLHNENEVIDIEEEVLGRSRRFLRISQQLVSSESATREEDGGSDDENEDEIADADCDPRMVAYRNADLVFQDFATRRYLLHSLHDDEETKLGLRIKASHAHAQILETCVDLIIGVGKSRLPREAKPNGLQHYALHFWQHHFHQLSDPVDEDISVCLIRVFHRIAVESTAFATALLRHGPPLEVVLPDRQQEQVAWYDRIGVLAQMARDQHSTVLTEDVRQWLSQPEPKLILLPLAEGCYQAWMSETDGRGYPPAYRAVRHLIQLTGNTELAYHGENENEDISHHARLFSSLTLDTVILRTIGATHCLLHFERRMMDRGNMKDIDAPFVVEHLDQSVLSATTSRDKIITQYLLGTTYWLLDRKDDAFIAMSKAVDEIAKEEYMDTDPIFTSARIDPEMAVIRTQTFEGMSNLCSRNGQYQQALDLLVGLKDFDATAWDGKEIEVIGLCMNIDPSGHKAMEMLKAWSKTERRSYFSRVYGRSLRLSADKQIILRHTCPASRTGEMELYMHWLQEGKPSLFQQHATALIYEIVLDDEHRAGELRRKIFSARPAIYDKDKRAEDVRAVQQENWRREAAAIYRRFQATNHWKDRENLLGEIESLPILPFQHRDEVQESQVGMLRAYMLRVLGPNSMYREAMEKLFNLCMEGLEDGVSYNDGPSLRLLTKVLSLLPNLERDASIAYTAQFSILDRKIAGEGTSAWIDDEDLTGAKYSCDGCRRPLSKWTSTQYMCLVCPNLDFCESCYQHEQKSRSHRKPKSNPNAAGVWADRIWHPFCDRSHAYIKGPMKDWKGVRGGHIRIGIKQIEVKEWLRGLKEQRWKQSWEDFWSARNELRNVGCD